MVSNNNAEQPCVAFCCHACTNEMCATSFMAAETRENTLIIYYSLN